MICLRLFLPRLAIQRWVPRKVKSLGLPSWLEKPKKRQRSPSFLRKNFGFVFFGREKQEAKKLKIG